MEKDIDKIWQTAKKQVEETSTKAELVKVNAKFLGKSGEVSEMLKNLKNLPQDERKSMGQELNDLRNKLTTLFEDKFNQFEKEAMDEALSKEKVDVTIPAQPRLWGGMHPVEKMKQELIEYFVSQGFELRTGYDIESDYYCFEALNIPKDHPAREMQDTFYIDKETVLRTQTSSMQVRVMENQTPPIKMISMGNVYRIDEIDATHSPMFSQLEILVVDKNVSMADCIGTIEGTLKHILGEKTKIRVRPSFFPFTEPSIEVDASCPRCGGKCGGCPMCKDTGFVEMLGAGMVNPKVLENCNVDSKVYRGFAAGFGLERLTMMKYGISDMRDLYENDINLIKQFR